MALQDLRYAVRMMRRNRGFTATAVVSLALGIGANTAIFSLIDSVMLRPLPVRNPGELVEPLYQYPTDPRLNGFTLDAFHLMRDHNHSLGGLTGSRPAEITIGGEPVECEFVDGGYFELLGIKAAAGRLVARSDEKGPSAVVSWDYWKRTGAGPGRQLVTADAAIPIAGVAPRGFSGIVAESRTQIWLPLPSAPAARGSLQLIGRLKGGVSLARARAELGVLYRQSIDAAMLRRDPNWGRVQFELESASAGLSREVPPDARIRDQFSRPLLFLMGVVGLLLMIACTNVGSILLARATARQREMALRVSLGAGRVRLLRQVLTESLLLALAGAAGGLALAWFGAQSLVRIMASGRGHVEIAVRPDARVLLFTIAAAAVASVMFGVMPALRAMAVQPVDSLRAGVRSGETRSSRMFGKALIGGQVVFAMVLLTAAWLCLSRLSDLRNVNLGFRSDHILLANLNPARSGYSGERLVSAYRELLGRLETIPGVRSATLSSGTPISGGAASRFANAEGYTPKPIEQRVFVRWVAPRFFATYGIPLVAGRDLRFEEQGNGHVAILSQSMARYYFGEANPLGRHVTLERDDQPFEVIGIAGDAKYLDLYQPPPRTIYLPAFRQDGVNSNSFAIRTSGDPESEAREMRRAMDAVLKDVPPEMRTLSAQMDASIVPERLIAMVSSLFGALGMLLAAIGVYGLLAYTIARRTAEIGVRMALGATRGGVLRLVLVEALMTVGAGLVVAIPLAVWSERFAVHFFEGMRSGGLLPIALSAVMMLAMALLAAYLPARRASRVDPMVALRYE